MKEKTEDHLIRIERATVAIPGVGEVPVPAVVAASGPELANRFLEFFLVAVRNPNTRRAYAAAVRGLCTWLERHGARDLAVVEPVHVAAYVEQLGRTHTKPSVALHLAAIKRLFAFLVAGGTLKRSPAVEVKGPTFSRRVGATPVTSTEEVRKLLDSLPMDSLVGLRDRALIGTLLFTTARIGAALGCKVGDYYGPPADCVMAVGQRAADGHMRGTPQQL